MSLAGRPAGRRAFPHGAPAAAAVLAGGALGLLGPTLALAQPSSPFAPASPQARSISDLFWVLLAISALIFLLVQGLIVYMAIRFRARPGAGEPRQVFGNRRLEIAWTAAPALLLVVVFGLMLPVMSTASGPGATALSATVVGHQFWWELRYPELGVVTANELHIPAGEPVRVRLESADVIHSFWVPRLNGKLDVIPGKPNEISLQADQPGTYLGQCAEFCGLQHAGMLLRVIAQPRAEFDAWVARQRQPAAAPTGEALRGQQVFLEQTCVNCHAIQGTAATAAVAPDLTHVGGRQTLAAGVIDNTPENMRRWLREPQRIKPGARMPAFHLADADVRALATYLEGLK